MVGAAQRDPRQYPTAEQPEWGSNFVIRGMYGTPSCIEVFDATISRPQMQAVPAVGPVRPMLALELICTFGAHGILSTVPIPA